MIQCSPFGLYAFFDSHQIFFKSQYNYGVYRWTFDTCDSLPYGVYAKGCEWTQAFNANPTLSPKVLAGLCEQWLKMESYGGMTLKEFLEAAGATH